LDILLVVLIAIGAPTFVFLVFGVAFGLNPAKAAAWGAIVGMAAVVTFLAIAMHPTAPRAVSGPWNDYAPTGSLRDPSQAKDGRPAPQAPEPPSRRPAEEPAE
jgi:hypothetical protein